MKSLHTKGEWIMENPDNRKANFVIYTTENPEGIINVYPGEEAEANAKLIAAAPELLKAAILCESITDKCNNAMLSKNVQNLLLSINETLKEAIQKATI